MYGRKKAIGKGEYCSDRNQLTRHWLGSEPNTIDWGGGRFSPPLSNSETYRPIFKNETAMESPSQDDLTTCKKVWGQGQRSGQIEVKGKKSGISAFSDTEQSEENNVLGNP